MRGDQRRTSELPSALDALDSLLALAPRTFVCLDYDGTLTPIVARPENAVLSPEMRSLVIELAALCPTAIVSGRDRLDVERRVGVPAAYYVGSHGFDVAGPPSRGVSLQVGAPYLTALDGAEATLRDRTAEIPGALVERKRFSIATHYRLVARDRVAEVLAIADQAVAAFPGLRRESGKEVVEVRPDVAWDKGQAVLWLIGTLGLDEALAMHLGDDLTDESVFAVLTERERGVGVFVGREDRLTSARFRLRDTSEVGTFLGRLIAALRDRTSGRSGGRSGSGAGDA